MLYILKTSSAICSSTPLTELAKKHCLTPANIAITRIRRALPDAMRESDMEPGESEIRGSMGMGNDLS